MTKVTEKSAILYNGNIKVNGVNIANEEDLSHYKSMGILPDAQWQLTPQSLVVSGPNSNLSEILWVVLITCKYEEDPIK